MTLAETIDLVGAPVSAVTVGTVGGPAVAVFASADRRLAAAHALFALREPRVELTGRADELAAAVERHERRLAYLRARVAEATGQSTDKVGADMRAGRTLSAAEAVAYGLVHELVRGSR